MYEFAAEISALVECVSPYTLQYIGCSLTGTVWSIVTEFMAGGNLREHIAHARVGVSTFGLGRRLHVLSQVAAGVLYLHTKV